MEATRITFSAGCCCACLRVFFACLLMGYTLQTTAQSCPPNIDFEEGNFTNWTCYTGNVDMQTGIVYLNVSGPVYDRHTINNTELPDYFGGFPMTCPYGSGHSLRLGDRNGGCTAEGVSYEFTIPANEPSFTFIYYYALVLKGGNGPRLEVEIMNMTDNERIYCPSATYNASTPNCYVSPFTENGYSVIYKDWTPVTVNLNGKAGKKIRVFFKTIDGTDPRVFSYAYVDIASNCRVTTSQYAHCPGDTIVRVPAPPGYRYYTWFNNSFTQILHVGQTITLQPPPAPGTILAVQAIPFTGFGCVDTFYYTLRDTLQLTADAGIDKISCNQRQVSIGAPPRPGYVYSWFPTDSLNNPYIADPLAAPAVTTTYVLTVRSPGGGCIDTDTMTVTTSTMDESIHLLGKASFCTTSADSAVLFVTSTDSIQWYRDFDTIPGATAPRYRALQAGLYQAVLKNAMGCLATTVIKKVLIESPVPGIRYPDESTIRGLTIPLTARRIGDSVLWNPAFFLSADTALHPRFTGTATQQYTITQITGAGCTTIDTLLVKVYKDIRFYVPTAFTPNRDGLNDYLAPVTEGISSIRYFRIYNRWGQLVYAHKPGSPGWDGSLMGMPQPMQTVVWIAEGVGVDKKVYREKGSCLLLK